MIKFLTVSMLLAFLLAEVSAQRFILPTFRPPPRKPVIIRTIRDTEREQPRWLHQGDIPRAPATGDHPVLPHYMDDVKIDPNRRYTRSLDSPSAKRYGRSVNPSPGAAQLDHKRDVRSLKPGAFDPIPRRPFPYDPLHPRPGRPRPYPIYIA